MAMATTAKRKAGVPGIITGSLAEDYRSLERQQGTVRVPARDTALPREKTYVDAIPQPRERARVRTRQYVSPVMALGGVALVVMTVMLLLCHVQMAMLSSSVVSMQNTLSDLKSEQVVLKTAYEQAYDLASVKEAAKAAGMTQPSESQIYYIDIADPDHAVVYGDTTGVMNLLEGLMTKAKLMLEYFS